MDFRSDGGTFCLPRGCLKRPKNEGQEPPISSLLEVHIFTKNAEAPRSLKNKIRGFYISCQQELFPQVEQHYGSLPKRYRKLMCVFEMVVVENFLPCPALRSPGYPLAHRASLARSFLAKMVLNIPTTSGLHERLLCDKVLRSLHGSPPSLHSRYRNFHTTTG